MCSRKDNSEHTTSIHHKVSDRLETGMLASWVHGSNDTGFALAAKYNPDKDTTLRVRTEPTTVHFFGVLYGTLVT